jgi:hypothetical protein
MIATLCREYYPKQTHGTLTLTDEETGDEVFKCRTLELPWLDNQRNVSCIPEGYYDVDFRTSAKYPKHFIVNDVPGRSFILIHQGNYAGSLNPKSGKSDIRGCILVGKAFVDLDGDGLADITSSKSTLNKLLEVAPDGFVLEVTQ